MRFEDKANQFAKTIRILSRDILGFSRYTLLLEGHSAVLMITPNDHLFLDVGKHELISSMQETKERLSSKIAPNTFLGAVLRDDEAPISAAGPSEPDQEILEVRSRVPAISYVLDSNVRKNLEKVFGSRAGDVRNLFMEIARKQLELPEIQSYLLLDEEELLEMVTWGVEEGLLYIEGEE